MLIKIKIIILLNLITFNLLLAEDYSDLNLTNEGIVATSINKVLNRSIKKDMMKNYLYTIGNLKSIGEVIFYESLGGYKKYCYLPIKKIANSYKIKSIVCIEIINDFTMTPPINWMGTYTNLKAKDLEKSDLIKLIENKNIQKESFAKLEDNKLVFYNLPLINNDGKKILDNHVFLIRNFKDEFPFISLSDIVIPEEKNFFSKLFDIF